MNKAVIYIVSGDKYVKEASKSAKGIDNYPCYLFTPDECSPDNFDEVIKLPPRQFDYWYIDCVNYLNMVFELLPDVERFLLLDSDTYVCGDLEDFFTILDRFDIAGTQAVGRETMIQRDDIPLSFPELHVGALSFSSNVAVRILFETWFRIFKSAPDFFGNNDQGPLRSALWFQPLNYRVRLAILPPEFCFRYRWGGLISGEVRVLHGHEHNVPHEKIAKEVNEDPYSIRVYHRRDLA